MYLTTNMTKNNVYSILIEDWDEEITGVFVAEGKLWILLLDNQNDFVVDGLRFIQKSKIDEVLHEESEAFKEKIFALKYPKFTFQLNYDLDDTQKLLRNIVSTRVLIHFDTDDEEEIIVGKIEKVFDDSFQIKTMNSTGEWAENFNCEFSEVTSIALDNDYLKSLTLLLN
ncbi:hypothetical protein [Flavicella marina]|uniref:hypothetical protein n=1 Tax=Flavicella marina TaxID=1475951 RepID=UPI001265711C|nr:hypothetical protein [Flavicella marina]